jgi:hypothetical protein
VNRLAEDYQAAAALEPKAVERRSSHAEYLVQIEGAPSET